MRGEPNCGLLTLLVPEPVPAPPSPPFHRPLLSLPKLRRGRGVILQLRLPYRELHVSQLHVHVPRGLMSRIRSPMERSLLCGGLVECCEVNREVCERGCVRAGSRPGDEAVGAYVRDLNLETESVEVEEVYVRVHVAFHCHDRYVCLYRP